MTNNDLRAFTHKELRAFTNGELRQPPEKLVQAIEQHGSEIPYNTYVKLCKLCDDFNTELAKNNAAPIAKPSISVKDVLDYFHKFFYLIRSIPELRELLSGFLDLFL